MIKAFIKGHPILTYYVLVFLVSWGSFLVVGGRGFLAGTSWQTDTTFLPAISAMLLGPPAAGLLSVIFISQKAGLCELLSRLFKWQVGGRWYATALLIAPIVEAVVLFSLSQISSVFLPKIVTVADKVSLLLSGIAIGFVGGFMEELGWTGFVIPQLRTRFSILSTGLIVGVFWGIWHMLQMWWVGGTSAEALPPFFFLTLYFLFAIAQLTAYRVLMVWVYDNTKSLLVAILMHSSYIASTLFVLAPPTTGISFLFYSGLFTITLWFIVAVVALVTGYFQIDTARKLSRGE